jgi:hypothetical protein
MGEHLQRPISPNKIAYCWTLMGFALFQFRVCLCSEIFQAIVQNKTGTMLFNHTRQLQMRRWCGVGIFA